MRLSGKVAVVTGASSGIGLATARRFVEEGAAQVFLTGRGRPALNAAAASLGPSARAVAGDLGDLGDLDRLVTTVRESAGRVDVVVSAAGLVETVDLPDATPQHFDRTFGVNARGTFFLVQRLLPLLGRGGSIVLVSSVTHEMGVPGLSAYSASKAAVRSFARTWAVELADRGIRVNSLSPGPVDTPAIDAQASGPDAATAARLTMARATPRPGSAVRRRSPRRRCSWRPTQPAS